MYNFKKNCKVYIVRDGLGYPLSVYPDISFSQTYEEKEITNKTLHEQHAMFSGSVINKANPANFNFTVMLGLARDFKVICNWMSLVLLYDMYIDTGERIFKISDCVIERGTFNFTGITTISLAGSGRQLSEIGSLPPINTEKYNDTAVLNSLRVMYNNDTLENITSLSVEFINDVKWLDYDTLQKSLYVTQVSDTQYPETFVVSSRTLSGTIQRNLLQDSDGWSTNATLGIIVGDYFGITIPSISTTINTGIGDLLYQTISFRLNSNSTQLFIERNDGYSISLDFANNTYNVYSLISDGGTVFTFDNPGATVALNFTKGQYELR